MQDPFVNVFQAYRQGIVRKAEPSATVSFPQPLGPRSWEDLVLHVVIDRLPLQARHLYYQTTRTSFQGLVTTRKNQLLEARPLFDQALQFLQELRHEPARTMARAFVLGNIAYFEHKVGDDRSARDLVEGSLDANLALEAEFGLPMYQMHRIQLGHNLARLDWKEGRMDQAFSLCGKLVGFLEGCVSSLPYHHDWRPEHLPAVPRFLIQAMILQVAAETGLFLTCNGPDPPWKVFLDNATLPTEEQDLRYLQSWLWVWFRAKERQLEGHLEEYLNRLAEILPAGPSQLGTVFYAILADLASVCSQSRFQSARKVREVLVKDSEKWLSVPPPVTQRFQQLAA